MWERSFSVVSFAILGGRRVRLPTDLDPLRTVPATESPGLGSSYALVGPGRASGAVRSLARISHRVATESSAKAEGRAREIRAGPAGALARGMSEPGPDFMPRCCPNPRCDFHPESKGWRLDGGQMSSFERSQWPAEHQHEFRGHSLKDCGQCRSKSWRSESFPPLWRGFERWGRG